MLPRPSSLKPPSRTWRRYSFLLLVISKKAKKTAPPRLDPILSGASDPRASLRGSQASILSSPTRGKPKAGAGRACPPPLPKRETLVDFTRPGKTRKCNKSGAFRSTPAAAAAASATVPQELGQSGLREARQEDRAHPGRSRPEGDSPSFPSHATQLVVLSPPSAPWPRPSGPPGLIPNRPRLS